MRVLVVEDDTVMAEFVAMALREEGHAVDVVHRGAEGRTLALVYDYDAVVLDLMLPDENGDEVVRRLRENGRATPVLMLTARDGKDDVIRGLDAGADDYLAKPFVVGELLARLRALVRRGGAVRPERIAFGDLEVDRLRHRILCEGRKLSLTPKEYALAEAFLSNPGRVVTRSELLEKVWEIHFDPGSNVVDVHVTRLRGKLQRAGSRVAIGTVRGSGFILQEGEDAKAEG